MHTTIQNVFRTRTEKQPNFEKWAWNMNKQFTKETKMTSKPMKDVQINWRNKNNNQLSFNNQIGKNFKSDRI